MYTPFDPLMFVAHKVILLQYLVLAVQNDFNLFSKLFLVCIHTDIYILLNLLQDRTTGELMIADNVSHHATCLLSLSDLIVVLKCLCRSIT
jgi:hypothetical protein